MNAVEPDRAEARHMHLCMALAVPAEDATARRHGRSWCICMARAPLGIQTELVTPFRARACFHVERGCQPAIARYEQMPLLGHGTNAGHSGALLGCKAMSISAADPGAEAAAANVSWASFGLLNATAADIERTWITRRAVHARVRGAAAFDGDHGLATPKVVRGNVPNQPRCRCS
jgi:hypothetical protein